MRFNPFLVMPKKLTLDLPDETYTQLSDLASSYKLDLKSAALGVLGTVCRHSGDLSQVSRSYTEETTLEDILNEMLYDYPTMRGCFVDGILRTFGAEGLFRADSANTEFNLDADFLSILYDPNTCKARKEFPSIHNLLVRKEDGQFLIGAMTYTDENETSPESLAKLADLAEETENPFDCEEFRIEFDEGFDGHGTLTVDCWSSAIDELPKVKQLSKFVDKLLKKAGVSLGK